MLIAGLGFAVPFLLLVALIVFGPWTDRWGWTRTKGRERAMMTTALQGYNLAVMPELNAAVEYQKQCHDEEDAEGQKKRPHFPGISNGTVTIRPLRDTPHDLAMLSGWLADATDLAAVRDAYIVKLDEFEVPCIVEANGEAVGYLQFARLPQQPGTYRVGNLLGPGCSEDAVRPLVAYLYEFEGAARVVSPTLETARPAECRYYLLH